jgi:non-lysosomal glucosylceramidase
MNSSLRGWRRLIGARHPDPFTAKPDQQLTDDGPVQGVPLGGLGTGSIGRDHDGGFSRWHLAPGRYRYRPSPGSWLGVELAGGGPPVALVTPGSETRPAGLAPPAGLVASIGSIGEYEALFPFAWHRYRPEVTWGVRVEVRQWSPVIAGREDESSWPVGCLEVTLTNEREDACELTVAFAFELPVDDATLRPAGPVEFSVEDGSVLSRLPAAAASFSLAVEGGDQTAARALGGDAEYEALASGLWRAALNPGAVSSELDARPGLAAAARVRLTPGEQRTVAFALAWDLPQIRFGEDEQHRWHRAHTRRFGTGGTAAGEIANTLLAKRDELTGAIERWHEDVADRLRRHAAPDWMLADLCNELYMLVEGGTAWVTGQVGADRPEEHFAVLESVDYKYYETLDVRYYSSFVLLELWPRLEGVVMRDYLRTIPEEDPEPIVTEWSGHEGVRKRPGSAPHDLGGPLQEPFCRVNAYVLQDSGAWVDLNPKFVLQVVRYVSLLGDDALAAEAWPNCRTAIRVIEGFDSDGDGLPDHDGVPDQTYDTWPMRGISAYCADLWLACLAAGEWLAARAGDHEEAERLAALRARCQPVVEDKLWTGTYYRFDSSGGPASEVVMADQLAGTWYAKLLKLPEPHPDGRAARALETVLDSNFRGFAQGRLGPVNGRSPDGGPVGSEQADEVWVGAAWGMASLALLLGRDDEAWQVAGALHRTLYEDSGLWFRTPEAWTEEREYRASMYHRPLAVWSVYTALRLRD